MLEDGIEKGMRTRGEKIQLNTKVPENKIKDKTGNSEMALSFRIAFFGVFADFFKWLAKKEKKKKERKLSTSLISHQDIHPSIPELPHD